MIDISLRARMARVIEQVRYPGYNFGLHYGINDDSVYLQASYWEPDVHAPDAPRKLQKTRKWRLSGHMTDSELVFTCLKCVLTSMEHRTREWFTYKGERIASPHFDVEDLVRLCRQGRADAGAREG